MRTSKRRYIEIYFILYLAAIIFLLPDKKNVRNDNASQANLVAQGPFTLQPLKTILNCKLSRDSAGIVIVSLDSTNTILYSGDVEEIKFDFMIEDLNLRQREKINTYSKYFRFVERPQNNAVDFFWTPPLDEKTNKTYIVNVIATARLKANSNTPVAGRTIIEKTQFSLNLVYNILSSDQGSFGIAKQNFPIQGDNKFTIDYLNQNRYASDLKAEMSIQPLLPEVKSIAYQKWTNQIYVFNANAKGSLGKPDIKVIREPDDNNGTAELSSIEDNKIILKGKTPSHGRMKVIVSYRTQRKEMSVDFVVLPVAINPPVFDNVMYPEKYYTVNPNLPFVSGQDTKAFIKDGEKILMRSEQGEKMQFKPDLNHVGKSLILERVVDGVPLDQYQIRILNYSDPQIVSMQTISENEVRVVVNTYGYHNQQKNISRLEIEGNASSRELLGKAPKSPDQITNIQYFKVTPKNPDKPFNFKTRAVDARGKRSSQKAYNE